MRALQLTGPQRLELVDVPTPPIAERQVLLRVSAAGVCHTDLSIRDDDKGIYRQGLILGHEIAGVVDQVGAGVSSDRIGEEVIVYSCWSCGTCQPCVAGRQNACRGTGGRMLFPPVPGVQLDGGMAELVAVPASSLVSATGLDTAVAAILPDAAIVPYHSIVETRKHLGPGSIAVVIGIGGLGHLAIQMLRSLTPSRVVAIDINDKTLDRVREDVDLACRSDEAGLLDYIVDFTGGYGVDVVFDFVGNDATLSLAAGIAARYGAIRVPGLGCGTLPFETSIFSQVLPWGTTISRPFSGTFGELSEVVALARSGGIRPTVQRYAFEDALAAFDDLDAGRVQGRAVLMMK